MKKYTKILFINIIMLFLISGAGPFSIAGAAGNSVMQGSTHKKIQITNGMISVNLKDIALEKVVTQIEKQGNLWVRGDESLFEDSISVQFEDLSLEAGLKRIFASMNYSLIFDQDSKLEGIILIGRQKPGRSQTKRGSVKAKKGVSSMISKKRVSHKGFKAVKSDIPPGGPVKDSKRVPESFKVTKSSPPPGDPVNKDIKNLENFKVIKNSPLPGN